MNTLVYGTLLLLISNYGYAGTERPEGTLPVHKKNLAHSFTPVTTFGFGQNIIDKRSIIFYPFMDYTQGEKTHLITLSPVLLYGITNNFSIYGELPFILSQKAGPVSSKGLGNIVVQMEYAVINQKKETALNQLTIVANISPPTAHLKTSFDSCCDLLGTETTVANSTSVFLGTTASHLSLDWYLYGAVGVNLYMQKNCTKAGATVYYQWGIGHYLANPWNCTFAGVLEFNGIYNRQDSIFGHPSENTKGNTLFIGPSLFLGADRWQILGGIQGVAFQSLQGVQYKQHLEAVLSFAIQF